MKPLKVVVKIKLAGMQSHGKTYIKTVATMLEHEKYGSMNVVGIKILLLFRLTAQRVILLDLLTE